MKQINRMLVSRKKQAKIDIYTKTKGMKDPMFSLYYDTEQEAEKDFEKLLSAMNAGTKDFLRVGSVIFQFNDFSFAVINY